jgi:hypothetical protein
VSVCPLQVLDNIFRQTLEEGLRHKLTGVLEVEERPDLPATGMWRHLVRLCDKMHGAANKRRMFFPRIEQPIEVTMHGPEWDKAAEAIRVDQVAPRVSRLFNLTVIDPLLRNAINYTLNVFASDSSIKEQQKKADDEIALLEQCRDNLRRHMQRLNVSPTKPPRTQPSSATTGTSTEPKLGGSTTTVMPSSRDRARRSDGGGARRGDSAGVWLERVATTAAAPSGSDNNKTSQTGKLTAAPVVPVPVAAQRV